MRPVCVITGSAGSLGSALSRTLLSTHEVAAIYRQNLPDVASQLRTPADLSGDPPNPGSRNQAYCIQGDLTNDADTRRIVEVVLARFGRIDVVINSAADIRYHGNLLDIGFDSDAVERQLVTNCVAPMKLVSVIFHEFWKHEGRANAQNNRCVVNISSVSGLYVFPSVGQSFYSASKAALNFLTVHLAYELSPYSVRSNAVCPVRFPESVPTEKVVSTVQEVIASRGTGEVVEVRRNSSPR